MDRKSDKELAFLYDLYVATDWGERFAALVDQRVELPKTGRALYLAAGTGGHAMALQERAGTTLKFLCADASDECLELARAKAAATSTEIEFRRETPNALSFLDDEFDFVLGDGSMIASELSSMFGEMVRVARPGATVVWWLTTASSFGEFFSIYWEALLRAGLEDHITEIEDLIKELPTVAEVERWAEREGLENVLTWTSVEEFDYDSSDQFLNSPLITDFLLRTWLRPLPETDHQRVTDEIGRVIDEERREQVFALSMKATLVVGKKSKLVQ